MNAIEVDNVSKKFRLGAMGGDLRERFSNLFRRSRSEEDTKRDFWALRDISFNVEEGESFGIIGHNGSGKSTLLKLITGIYTPTSGSFKTHGRVSALIEVGAGFHPDLTGRENVYLNGSVLGLKKREIDKKFDDIVAFAELEQFIDTPVKRYSSGMYMRLGFAVAAHVDPDIVLVDEVLAVGDESFQRKCMDKMLSLRRDGKTIVFISHNMDAVTALCQKVMLLSHGHMLALGEPEEVISTYRSSVALEQMRRSLGADVAPSLDATVGTKTRKKDIEILETRLLNDAGQDCDTFETGETLRLECLFRANIRVESPAFGIAIFRSDDLNIFGPNTRYDNVPVPAIEGEGRFSVTFPNIPLMQGMYRVVVATFYFDDVHNAIDVRHEAATFKIVSRTLNHGTVSLAHTWSIETRDGATLASSQDEMIALSAV